MNKCHTPITWVNNTSPALNATNLNQYDGELDTLDDRIIALDSYPPANALKAEGWANGEQNGTPVTSGSPYYENNSKYYSQQSAAENLVSEGYANGTQNGTPVTSGSPYYENNAKYWKEQAAAIAGQTLGGLTDVSITSATDGQALVYDSNSSEWVNSDVGVKTTNPNLLINPWFTVNQRGSASYTLNATNYCVDRWTTTSGGITVAVSSSGITVTNSNNVQKNIVQKIEDTSAIKGKIVTFSLMFQNGTIISGTGTFPSENNTVVDVYTFDTDSKLRLYVGNDGIGMAVVVLGVNKSYNIRAVKLEIGSTSTLHLDTAPDYTTELLKCQRYFKRLIAEEQSSVLALGCVIDSSTARIIFSITPEMRAVPTMTTSGNFMIGDADDDIAVTNLQLKYPSKGVIQISATTAGGLTAGHCVRIYCSPSSGYIDLNAEL